jgi:hypothetical protein
MREYGLSTMALSGALTSTVTLNALRRAITSASKNKAAIADPVMASIIQRDAVLGPVVGALLQRMSLLDLGGGKATATAEGAAQLASAAVTPTNIAPAPTRREYARDLLDSERSQLAGLGMGELPPDILDAFVMEGVDVWGNTVLSDILALATGASYSAGTTGTALSWAALQNGYLDMVNRGAVGEAGVFAAIKVKGIKDVANDVLSLGGAVQMANQVQQFMEVGKSGYVGSFFGGLRLYMLDDVATSGGDDVGVMLSERGVLTAHKVIPLPESATVLVQAGGGNWISREAKRSTSLSATTRIETAFWTASAAADPAAMTKLIYVST